MKHVVLASGNPVKLLAVKRGFLRVFPGNSFGIDGISIDSGVGDQPMSDEATLIGATARAERAARAVPEADYWVGIEGGVEDHSGEMAAFAWVVVLSGELVGKGRTGTFYLPASVAELVRGGVELGQADDMVFGTKNSKQDIGAVGLLTGGVIDRTALYEHAVILALAPFKSSQLYVSSP